MRVNRLISLLARGAWFIEASAAADYSQLIDTLLSGGNVSAFFDDDDEEEDAGTLPFAICINAAGITTGQRYSAYDDAPAGSVAVITVAGPMSPDDNCGSPGTETLGQRIQDADQHPNIGSIVLRLNTPGGAVDGLEQFAGIVGATAKPIVSFVQKAASAGYWTASQSDLIVLSGKTAGVGSIGTMASLRDFSKMDEARGIKSHDITATASKHKNAAYFAALQGDYAPLRAETLDPLNNAFLAAVEERRGASLPAKQKDEVLGGKMYYGQAGIDNGLADEMGDFNYAVRRASELAAAQQSGPNPVSPTSQNTMFGKFRPISALAGLMASAVTAELVAAANDSLAAENVKGVKLVHADQLSELEAKAKTADDAEARAKKAGEDLDTEAKGRQKAETDLAASQKEVERLSSLSAGSTTNPVRTSGKSEVDEDENSAESLIANQPHSRALDNHPLFK